MKGWFSYIVLIATAFSLGWCAHGRKEPPGTYADTVHHVETIPFFLPVPRDSVVLKYETARLPVKDSSGGELPAPSGFPSPADSADALPDSSGLPLPTDSADVVIPITQKVFGDSTYRAWVSGYRPNLDSIYIYSPVRTIYVHGKEREKRFGIGLSVGYGAGRGGMSPFVGITLNWNVLRF